MTLHHRGFPIRKSAGHSLFPTHRSLSQVIASFIGSQCQGIHLTLFFAWTAVLLFSLVHLSIYLETNSAFIAWASQIIVILGCKLKRPFGFIIHRSCYVAYRLLPTFDEIVFDDFSSTHYLYGKTFKYSLTSFSQYTTICFVSFSLFGFQWTFLTNLLEIRYWWRWWDSNPWPPACRAGALPAELHPHKNGS